MPDPNFDAPLFIKEIHETTINTVNTPFFYNDGGTPAYVSELPAGITPLTPATTNPAMAIGNEYIVAAMPLS